MTVIQEQRKDHPRKDGREVLSCLSTHRSIRYITIKIVHFKQAVIVTVSCMVTLNTSYEDSSHITKHQLLGLILGLSLTLPGVADENLTPWFSSNPVVPHHHLVLGQPHLQPVQNNFPVLE